MLFPFRKFVMLKFLILFIIFYFSILYSQNLENDTVPFLIDSAEIKGFYFEQYFPVPFSPVTYTEFGIPDTCIVKLYISDTTGTIIDFRYNGKLDPGKYRFDFYCTINKYRSKTKKLIGQLNIEAYSIKNGLFKKHKSIFQSSTDFIWIYVD